MLVCSPNVQAYGHPIAAKMPLIPYCPKSLYYMAVILRCLDTTARLHGYGAGFKLLMTLYNERWRLFLKCASEMGQIISVQLSLRCWKLVPMLCFPWQPNVQLHGAWSFSLFMISERATFLRAFWKDLHNKTTAVLMLRIWPRTVFSLTTTIQRDDIPMNIFSLLTSCED